MCSQLTCYQLAQFSCSGTCKSSNPLYLGDTVASAADSAHYERNVRINVAHHNITIIQKCCYNYVACTSKEGPSGRGGITYALHVM